MKLLADRGSSDARGMRHIAARRRFSPLLSVPFSCCSSSPRIGRLGQPGRVREHDCSTAPRLKDAPATGPRPLTGTGARGSPDEGDACREHQKTGESAEASYPRLPDQGRQSGLILGKSLARARIRPIWSTREKEPFLGSIAFFLLDKSQRRSWAKQLHLQPTPLFPRLLPLLVALRISVHVLAAARESRAPSSWPEPRPSPARPPGTSGGSAFFHRLLVHVLLRFCLTRTSLFRRLHRETCLAV